MSQNIKQLKFTEPIFDFIVKYTSTLQTFFAHISSK